VSSSASGPRHSSAEGLRLEAPEIYIAIAQGSCARFAQGDSLQQIVNDHLDATDTTPSADDEQLIGALLGAAVETICPEHASKGLTDARPMTVPARGWSRRER
jgi:hypothetical protein